MTSVKLSKLLIFLLFVAFEEDVAKECEKWVIFVLVVLGEDVLFEDYPDELGIEGVVAAVLDCEKF